MSFRLVPKSVTLSDLVWRNSPNGTVISPNSVAFAADYVIVVEDTPHFLRRKCSPKNVVFSGVSLMAILQGIAKSESVKRRHSLSLAKI